jgi:hypothetical protein
MKRMNATPVLFYDHSIFSAGDIEHHTISATMLALENSALISFGERHAAFLTVENQALSGRSQIGNPRCRITR